MPWNLFKIALLFWPQGFDLTDHRPKLFAHKTEGSYEKCLWWLVQSKLPRSQDIEPFMNSGLGCLVQLKLLWTQDKELLRSDRKWSNILQLQDKTWLPFSGRPRSDRHLAWSNRRNRASIINVHFSPFFFKKLAFDHSHNHGHFLTMILGSNLHNLSISFPSHTISFIYTIKHIRQACTGEPIKYQI